MNEKFKKFYLKTPQERRRILFDSGLIKDLNPPSFPEEKSKNVVENYIFNFEIPLGLAMNFKINKKDYIVPMAIEEPSVIAAASNGAKTLGNIEATMERKNTIGQIVLYRLEDINKAKEDLKIHHDEIFNKVKNLSLSMEKRGGGLKDIWNESFVDDEAYLSIYISIDTVDAMGANTINTILETLSPFLELITGGRSLMRIISNNSVEAIAVAKAKIPVTKLHKDLNMARTIARRIEKATTFAKLDRFRAATHNKGILNGVDALLISTGNDFRAVEAACHTYASREGNYRPLTNWKYIEESDILEGSIELPLPVATVGGTISSNPMAKWSLDILKNPTAKELACIGAALGLAQNFSALKAIVTDGIQKGHMGLHARSLASQAGAREEEIDQVVDLLKKENKINLEEAKKVLNEIRLMTKEFK